MHLFYLFLQQNLSKLATNVVFTVDFSRKFDLDFFWFCQQSEPLNKKLKNKNSDDNTVQILLFSKFFFQIFCIDFSDSVKIIVQNIFSHVIY